MTYSGYYNSPIDKALTYGVYLYNADAPSAKNVSITKGVFNSNTATGLYIRTRGSVSMNYLSATNNSIFTAADPNHHGVYIDAALGAGTVTLSDTLGSSSFNYNDGDGIHIVAKGTVSLTNLDASYNGFYAETIPYAEGMGVYINNLAGSGAVTLKKIYADYNRNSGVEVLTNGSVTLDTAELQYNGDSFTLGQRCTSVIPPPLPVRLPLKNLESLFQLPSTG